MKFNITDNIFRKILKRTSLHYKGYLENIESTVDNCEIFEAFTLKLETRQGQSLTTTSIPPIQAYITGGGKDERTGMGETKLSQMMGKEELE